MNRSKPILFVCRIGTNPKDSWDFAFVGKLNKQQKKKVILEFVEKYLDTKL